MVHFDLYDIPPRDGGQFLCFQELATGDNKYVFQENWEINMCADSVFFNSILNIDSVRLNISETLCCLWQPLNY